jgi:dolichyl-phosphate-mannose-protein mannosyltransferase
MRSASFGVSVTGRARLRLAAAALCTAALLWGCAAARAGGASSGAPDGRLAGFFSGAILLAFLCYSIFVYLKPLIERRDRDLAWALLFLLAVFAANMAMLPLFPGYHPDIVTYEAWAERVTSLGPAHTYQTGYFLLYGPGYVDALWAAGLFARALNASGTALRVIVESPALIANLILALGVFAFLRRSGWRVLSWVGMVFIALNPALIFDTVVWGQTDSAVMVPIFLSMVLLIDEEYELGWGLAALAVLMKPQALMVMPLLGLWTLLRGNFRNWWRAALAFVVIFAIGIAPYQIGHPWSWFPSFYAYGMGYFRETSLNAFNFMALIGGLRRPDSGTLFGISFFDIGIALLVPVYFLAGYLLWRKPTARNLIFSAFIAAFGFFLFAPRMHERYLYPAVVLVVPLAVVEPWMLVIFALLTMTCFFNLAYVKHVLETVIFLRPYDGLAMATAGVNLLAFAMAAGYGLRHGTEPEGVGAEAESGFAHALQGFKSGLAPGPMPAEFAQPIPWLRTDTILLLILVAAAAALRFWHLGHPHEIVFDEVHFVGQARHYLRGERFLDPHPPLAKLIIAAGIWLFGDHSWSWRVGNAILGTALVGVTYLLGRRMFRSRMTGALAAAFVLGDGLFLVDSRIGVIDIVYLTFAAISYLLFFRFVQSPGTRERKRALLFMGVALGLCLGSKLYVPAITFLLVMGFLVFMLARAQPGAPRGPDAARRRRITGAVALVWSMAAIFYLAVFIPHYLIRWWGGIADLFNYYSRVIWYEGSLTGVTHPYASPWWSWPLMLRPVAYWQHFPKVGDVATIWGAGNPLTWWGALAAITITAVRAIERPNLSRAFLVIGYLSYFVIWIPVERILFLYHYMPSVYLGYIALAAVLTDCWRGETEMWERVALLAVTVAAVMLGLGRIYGTIAVAVIGVVYMTLISRPRYSSRFVCVLFVAAAAALFVYFLPLWLGLPVTRSGYYARMWFQGPGLRNWI